MQTISLKKILAYTLISILFISCSKADDTPDDVLDEPLTGNERILVMGMFTGSGGYTVSGNVTIREDNGAKFLRFENFSSTNGPDLKVYLSRDLSASSFINLGDLKSVAGNQNYALAGMPDLAQYPYALIWCQQFGALFGSARLQ